MVKSSLYKKLRETGFHSIVYGFGSSVTALVNFVLTPLYTRHFSTEVYGVFALVNVTSSLAAIVFYLGASSAIARSYYDLPEGAVRDRAISTAVIMTCFGAVIQIFLGFALSSKMSEVLFSTPQYAQVIEIGLFNSALGFVNNLFIILMRYKKKSIEVVVLNVLSSALITIAVFLLLSFFGLGLIAPFIGIGVTQLLMFFALAYINRSVFSFDFCSEQLREQLKYGLQTVLAGVVFFGLSSADRYVLNKLVSPSAVGIYSLNYLIASALSILFIAPFDQIYGPLRLQYRHSPDAKKFFEVVATYFFILGTIMSVVISTFSFEIISIVSGRSEFSDGYFLVPFFMFGLLFFGGAATMANGVYFEKKVLPLTGIYFLGVLISMGLNYQFIPIFGYKAAAVNYLVTYVFISACLILFSNKFFPALIDANRASLVVGTGSLTVIIAILINRDLSVINAIYKLILIAGFLIFTYFFVLNDRERRGLGSLLQFRGAQSL